MSGSTRRVRAIFLKELREYRHNTALVVVMAILPLIFLIQPLVLVLTLPASTAVTLSHEHLLLYMLAIPALVPGAIAAYAVVGERQQGTLEPILTTPIRREELLLGKALAALAPSVVVAYVVYGVFLCLVAILARPDVAAGLLQGSDIVAQVLLTPLLAVGSIWLGIAMSIRSSDIRVAQQLSILASLPSVAVTSLIAFDVLHVTLSLAIGLTAVLLLVDGLGWWIMATLFDRERLVAGPGD